MSGEMVVAGSRLSPRTWRSVARVNRSRNSSRIDGFDEQPRARRGRPGRRRRTCAAAFSAARSRSASAKTTKGPLPPSSAVKGTRFVRRGDADEPPGLGRAGEGDPPNARVADQRGADLVAESLHQVEDPRRKLGLVDEVHQQRAAERRPLGGLEDDGVARRERRARTSTSRA